ncbi:hypothetical protein LCGC14_2951460 [marine sediment metagenome]|uniref:Uncharacterized protein n=1 Tax=marine sediment metagenome TaxID=412755 RepID=A0A0F8ZMR7_9ZZZZ
MDATVFISQASVALVATNGAWFFDGVFTVVGFTAGNVNCWANGSVGVVKGVSVMANALTVTFTEGSSHVFKLSVQMSIAGLNKFVKCHQLIIQEVA